MWLVHVGAPTDLVRRVAFLAQRLAGRRDEVTTLAMAGFGVADTLLFGGAFEVGRAKLDSITLPPVTADTAGLGGLVTAENATAALLAGRPDEVDALMDSAAELAERFGAMGDVDSLGFVFTPVDAGLFRMWHALEMGDVDRTVSIAQGMHPERHPFPSIQVYYWVDYGRALAQLRDPGVPGQKHDHPTEHHHRSAQ